MALHVKDIDTSQSDFQAGTLTNVEADAGGYLRLVDTDVLSFDGVDDYVDISGVWSNFLTANTPFSIECFFNSNNVSGQQELVEIGNGASTEMKGFRLLIFNAMLYGQTMDGTTRHAIFGGTLQNNTYYHACMTFDGTNMNLYLNGASVSTSVVGSWVKSTVAYLGAQQGVTELLNGNMSEARVWNTARTQQQIKDNMNKRLTGNEPGLVAYYKLDEGTGTVATDSAGANDGTITGATWQAVYDMPINTPYGEGNRISPQLDLSAVGTVESSSVSWTETLNSQTITIETRVSTDNGATWSAWKTCTNGGAIPDLPYGTDVSTALLECRQKLSTSDPTVTPRLESIALEINSRKFHGASLDVDSSASLQSVQAKKALSLSMDALAEVDSLTLQKVQNVLMDAVSGALNIALEIPALALSMDASTLDIEETIQTAASSRMSLAAGVDLQASFQRALEIALKTELGHLLMGAFQQEARPQVTNWQKDTRPINSWARVNRPAAADWRKK